MVRVIDKPLPHIVPFDDEGLVLGSAGLFECFHIYPVDILHVQSSHQCVCALMSSCKMAPTVLQREGKGHFYLYDEYIYLFML